MRVLALAHQWPPVHNAGAELMLSAMLRALVDRGHEVLVVLSRQPGEPYVRDGIDVVPERDKHHAVSEVLRADLVVTHLENTPRAAVLARLNGRPVVEVLHNTMPITKEWLAREPCALAVANSQWMAGDYRASFETVGWSAPPMLVVRPPVAVDDYATTPGDRVTLVNLRRMEYGGGAWMGKGAETFWAVAARMPKTQFLGVRGGYGDQLLADLPNVEVLPHLPAEHMRDKVYARTRVLLMPSSYESWGRTGVEAMCSGIPVVAHPTPGLVESLGDAGIFVDRDDTDGWVRALATLALPGPYRAAGRRARARAEELDPAADLAAWCDAAEEVAARGSSGRGR